jgi:hypothetical protein
MSATVKWRLSYLVQSAHMDYRNNSPKTAHSQFIIQPNHEPYILRLEHLQNALEGMWQTSAESRRPVPGCQRCLDLHTYRLILLRCHPSVFNRGGKSDKRSKGIHIAVRDLLVVAILLDIQREDIQQSHLDRFVYSTENILSARQPLSSCGLVGSAHLYGKPIA